MIREIIRQLIKDEMSKPLWIGDASHIVIGKSTRLNYPQKIFPLEITGITHDDRAIYAAINLPNGPSSEFVKPHLVVATNPNSNTHRSHPTWGNTQRLFLPNLVCRFIDDGNITYLKLSDQSRQNVIQSVINMGYNIVT